ncbi:kinase-like protein [Conidiobolus coronatus NRRL 28638]|uniref:Kinase-like protein n=1 Tax=Conidiobolus coronatus (strain ATCC 28846 / CBS 209.66 / NRRL 28638) TaxID=796925 RepID=A0A137NYA1_CONC2|nr:kinase-like protein [Conidiobolus coronatus NRRL 28638]|eukprot:KXN67579.1 kinase-like protein [Conidiobolus coronatus NRRL 28638]
MAKKSVPADPDPNTYRQIMRELQFLKQCQSPHIVSFYGAYLDIDQTTISMCMEYCQGGSLDDIYKRVQKLNQGIGEGILGKIAEAFTFHDNKIIHRDVKPSNILVTAEGNIKLCDFGVSGVLVHSIAQTFVGTSYYMAPERIQGYGYAVQSDIWSLGLTLLEIANGRFPFPPPGHPPLAIFELLDFIVKMPVPELSKPTLYSDEYKSFISDCLIKDPNHRPTPKRLLNEHPFLIRSLSTKLNLSQWINQVWA